MVTGGAVVAPAPQTKFLDVVDWSILQPTANVVVEGVPEQSSTPEKVKRDPCVWDGQDNLLELVPNPTPAPGTRGRQVVESRIMAKAKRLELGGAQVVVPVYSMNANQFDGTVTDGGVDKHVVLCETPLDEEHVAGVHEAVRSVVIPIVTPEQVVPLKKVVVAHCWASEGAASSASKVKIAKSICEIKKKLSSQKRKKSFPEKPNKNHDKRPNNNPQIGSEPLTRKQN